MLEYINKLKDQTDKAEEVSRNLLIKTVSQITVLEKLGGEILKSSKESINSSINNDLSQAEKSLSEASEKMLHLNKSIISLRKEIGTFVIQSKIKISDLSSVKLDALESDFSSANEEYLEAYFLFNYLKTKSRNIVKPSKTTPHDFKTCAGGLSDFCGELLRKAKLDLIDKKDAIDDISVYYKDIKKIYESLSVFSFSNKSGVRSKLEQLKGYIARMEDILYGLVGK